MEPPHLTLPKAAPILADARGLDRARARRAHFSVSEAGNLKITPNGPKTVATGPRVPLTFGRLSARSCRNQHHEK
jgi:hypothetical protein